MLKDQHFQTSCNFLYLFLEQFVMRFCLLLVKWHMGTLPWSLSCETNPRHPPFSDEILLPYVWMAARPRHWYAPFVVPLCSMTSKKILQMWLSLMMWELLEDAAFLSVKFLIVSFIPKSLMYLNFFFFFFFFWQGKHCFVWHENLTKICRVIQIFSLSLSLSFSLCCLNVFGFFISC